MQAFAHVGYPSTAMSDILTVYGIKQCDTCRKAIKWLNQNGIEHQFHDLRVAGFGPGTLDSWLQTRSIEQLLNRRSTSWRQLPAVDKATTSHDRLRNLLLNHPTLVKRPVLFRGTVLAVGFKPAELEHLLSQ